MFHYKRYGKEAADAAAVGFHVGMDVVETTINVKNLGVKKVAKKVAIATGKTAGMWVYMCVLWVCACVVYLLVCECVCVCVLVLCVLGSIGVRVHLFVEVSTVHLSPHTTK